jgi:hypothetical protein
VRWLKSNAVAAYACSALGGLELSWEKAIRSESCHQDHGQ